MQFVNNLNNLVVDDQYFMEVQVPQGQGNVPVGNIGLVGTFTRGPINTPTLVTSYAELVKKFGEVDPNFQLTGTITARSIFAQGNTNVYVVRVQSSTTPAKEATVAVPDGGGTANTVITLHALTPGKWGDGLVAIVSTGTKTNTVKISLSYGSESETWDNVVSDPASTVAGAIQLTTVFGTSSAHGLSNLAYGEMPIAPDTALPATGTYAFIGGDDGITGILPTDYVGAETPTKTGLSALDSAPINYVLCAEQTDSSLNTSVISNATTITQSGGIPRKAVITFPRATKPSGLSALMGTFDSDRAFVCYGYQQIFDPISNSNQFVTPLGHFAGLLAQLPPHYSTGNKAINGTLGVDPTLNLGPADFTTIAQARVNVVGVTTPAGNIGVRGGFTSSQTAGDSQQIYVRNMKDYIDNIVFTIGGQFVDLPITDDLMRKVSQTVDNILYPMKNPANAPDQQIADYKIQCDSGNNPQSSLDQNILVCDYAVKLLNMNRFMVFRTQIGSGVVITSTQQSA